MPARDEELRHARDEDIETDSHGLIVVDPDTMRVHGADGLRVVDASVLPVVTNGNIYAPTMMVAERAADLILGNTPLPPDPAEVHLP